MLTAPRKPSRSPHRVTRARGAIVRAAGRPSCAANPANCRSKRRWACRSRARLGSISQDSIGFEAGDANLYRYVGNQPTTKTDPSGLEPPQPSTGRPPIDLPSQEEIDEARRRLGRNRAMGGIAIAAHGSGLPAGAYGPANSSTRPLTPGELAMLNPVFGDHLDTDELCVGKGGLFPWVKKNSMTPRYTPWFPPKNYLDDFSKGSLRSRRHFIHEMTHVLQSQNGNWNWIDGPYYAGVNFPDYGLTYFYDKDELGRPLYEFNFEQQADIIADYYAGRFSGDELERCRKTLEGFETQLPAFIPDRRYIDPNYDTFDNSGWGYPHFVPKHDRGDSIFYDCF